MTNKLLNNLYDGVDLALHLQKRQLKIKSKAKKETTLDI